MDDAPTVAASLTGCCPHVVTATATQFELVNPSKVSNFILGEVVGGELTFVVENLPKARPTTGCPGWWLFARLMDHFEAAGTTIAAVVGSWTYGDNLATVSRLTGGGLSPPDAVAQTITATYAASRQYVRVTISSVTGSPGSYTRVRVLFTK